MVIMVKSFHDVINALIGIVMADFCQVEINHGGFEPAVAQIASG
jgi:hypothetical protein